MIRTQLSTIDQTVNQDGTSSWSGKFMQITNKVDTIVATGSGTGEPQSSKGIVKITGQGDGDAVRLTDLNGAK